MSDFIPTIDLKGLDSNNFNSLRSKTIIDQIAKASEEVGFFTVINHGISSQKIENLLSSVKDFFHSQEEEKLKFAPKTWNIKSNHVYRGYFPSSVNGKEGLDIGDPLITLDEKELLKKEKFEVNHDLSALNSEWEKIINDYYNEVFNLGMVLFKSIIALSK